MAAIYKDPETIRLVVELDKRQHTRDQIAERLGLSPKTVHKILDPDYAESERARLAAVDKARAATRRQDPAYRAYQAAANDTDAHRARVRAAKARRRGGDLPDAARPATWTEAAPAARAQAERVTADERRRAEAARTRQTVELSLEGSIAANRLLRSGGTWSALIDRLLIEAAAVLGTETRKRPAGL